VASITNCVGPLQRRSDHFKRQVDLTLELLTGPARSALDPHTYLSQHQANHRIEAAFDARRICASSEQKYRAAQQPKKPKKPKKPKNKK
jgi:hypothetical protein